VAQFPVKKYNRPREDAIGKVYQTTQWRRVRIVVLTRDPLCMLCNVAPATEVDHKTAMRLGGKPFDLENLQGLCERCHNLKSMRERHGGGHPGTMHSMHSVLVPGENVSNFKPYGGSL